MDVQALREQASNFINVVNQIEVENAASIRSKQTLEDTINDIVAKNESNKEALDIATHALEILRKISDDSVGQAYKFLQESLNSALAKMFKDTTRKIEIKEYTRQGIYPQLEFVLHVGNGKTRSLKSDSGHGIAQIVSLLSILSLIVITGGRRILLMDEILSGVSVKNRQIIDSILWTFTQIGFQFIVNEHGFVPEGSHVYHLEMVGNVSGIKSDYIAKRGVYLQGGGDNAYNDNGDAPGDSEEAVFIDTVNGPDTYENVSDQAPETPDAPGNTTLAPGNDSETVDGVISI